jgi:formylglycine-generating enzyme required for sulfatase activity
VFRGGGWNTDAIGGGCKVAYRNGDTPGGVYLNAGFRVAGP